MMAPIKDQYVIARRSFCVEVKKTIQDLADVFLVLMITCHIRKVHFRFDFFHENAI